MIGKIVERIIDAGFNVLVINDERFLTVRMIKEIDGLYIQIDWILTHTELETAHECVLLDECEQKITLLREAIEEKQRDDEISKKTANRGSSAL